MSPCPNLRISLRSLPADSATRIRGNIAQSPFGSLLIATTGDLICQISFLDTTSTATQVLHSQWPDATMDLPMEISQQIASLIFDPNSNPNHTLALGVHGTPFQIDIWKALMKIPRGKTVSYQQLAAMAGHPTAIRATGTAIGRNPVAILIPCHRVIRNNGQSGQYRWGPERKAALLHWEASS